MKRYQNTSVMATVDTYYPSDWEASEPTGRQSQCLTFSSPTSKDRHGLGVEVAVIPSSLFHGTDSTAAGALLECEESPSIDNNNNMY